MKKPIRVTVDRSPVTGGWTESRRARAPRGGLKICRVLLGGTLFVDGAKYFLMQVCLSAVFWRSYSYRGIKSLQFDVCGVLDNNLYTFFRVLLIRRLHLFRA